MRRAALGSHYGALPAHDGLWAIAAQTRDDIAARLALVPMALEARGLDVTPATVARFTAAGDDRSAAILRRIYADEIRHVAIGTKWFESLCAERRIEPAAAWHRLVEARARGIVRRSTTRRVPLPV